MTTQERFELAQRQAADAASTADRWAMLMGFIVAAIVIATIVWLLEERRIQRRKREMARERVRESARAASIERAWDLGAVRRARIATHVYVDGRRVR